jgi:paraquat-inducible protein B
MSKQANKTKIGAFVLGAIVLIVSGVLIFGSGKFMADVEKYVLYFEGSVKGLNVGAPVMFRGVKVGSVTDIVLKYNPDDLSVFIPVVIEVERDRFESVTGKKKRSRIEDLIERGLRAQLQQQSFVTGQLMVDLDFNPDEPAKLVGQESDKYPEVPTIASGLQKLTKTIEELPLDEIVHKLAKSLDGIERIINSPELQGSIVSLKKALDSADKLLVHIDKQVDPLMASIEDTSDAARGAFVQAEKTLAMEEGVPGELASNLKGTLTSAKDALASARDALKEAKETLAAYKGVVAEDSDLLYEVNTAMRELSEAARSIRYFVDYIDRHPEALLRGKKQ